jgi:hypothetical protein
MVAFSVPHEDPPVAHQAGQGAGHAQGEVVVVRVEAGLVGAEAHQAAGRQAHGAGHDRALLDEAQDTAGGHRSRVGEGNQIVAHDDRSSKVTNDDMIMKYDL